MLLWRRFARSPIRLQAFVDDSASGLGDTRLFLAGYLNRPDVWKLFSDAWEEELKTPPAIAYLRMVEANNLRGQFKGWTADARDQKLRGLARVIRHFEPFSFECTINRAECLRILTPVSPRGLGSPHFICTFGVIAGVARYVATAKTKAQIEFIFDEQDGVSADMRLLFHQMARSLPRSARRLVDGGPTYGNDKQLPPLQAADMLVWDLRREHERRSSPAETLPMADLLRNDGGHLVSHIEDSYIHDWALKYGEVEGTELLQSKGQWQNFRREISRFADAGLIPPKGRRLNHLLFKLRVNLIAWKARRNRRSPRP